MKCDCTSRAKPFSVAERDSIFGTSILAIDSPSLHHLCSTPMHAKLENRVSLFSFLVKTSVVIVVLFGLNQDFFKVF